MGTPDGGGGRNDGRRWMVLFLAGLTVARGAGPAAAQAGRHPDRPSRVLIIMLDQARPDTIERYGMKNVQALMKKGTSFPNALVGHMAAETVISHNVITSGQFPKHMGWSNEVYRDVDGVLGAPGDFYVTSSLSCAQFKALIEHGGYRKLPDYLDDRFGETSKFVSIAQKRSAVCPAGPTSSAAGDGTATDPEDIILQIRGSSAPDQCDGLSGWRVPEDANPPAPAYFDLASPCNRWWTWQGSPAYGTGSILPARIYPLEGNRFVPGRDPAHLGGDVWSADAAITRHPERPGLARHAREPRRHRQDGPHVGARGRGDGSARLRPGDAAHAVHRQDGRRAGRQDRRCTEGAWSARRHPRRHHGRSRRPDRPRVLRALRHLPARRSGQQSVRPGHRLDRAALRLQLVLRA